MWDKPVPPGGALAWTTKPLTQDVETLGPASADLWISSTSVDTDLQVTITEVRPDGQETYVARGWLRASQRKLDPKLSTVTRPYQTQQQSDLQLLTPLTPVLARVEVFPFDHVFRARSAIRMIVDTPSQTGGWNFLLRPTAAQNTILHDREHPSRLVLGTLPGGRANGTAPRLQHPAQPALPGQRVSGASAGLKAIYDLSPDEGETRHPGRWEDAADAASGSAIGFIGVATVVARGVRDRHRLSSARLVALVLAKP